MDTFDRRQCCCHISLLNLPSPLSHKDAWLAPVSNLGQDDFVNLLDDGNQSQKRAMDCDGILESFNKYLVKLNQLTGCQYNFVTLRKSKAVHQMH
eukprot:10848456-Ditylum_brightwellii.AAC.1